MPAASIQVALDEDEWRLVRSLREIPESPLRARTQEVIGALLGFAARPGCPESQADGVPCDSVGTACDRCQKVTGLLEHLRRQVQDE